MDADFPAAVAEANVIREWPSFLRGGLPESVGELAVEVPACLGGDEAECAIGAMGMGGERIGGEDESSAARVAFFEPGHERAKHPAADPPALVFRGDMHRPEVDAGLVAEVDGDAPDSRTPFAGDEVAMGTGLVGPCEHFAGALRIVEVAKIEGLMGEAVFDPGSELGNEIF